MPESLKGLEYNTERPDLVIPEYGRNVKNMIDYAMSIEDREERNKIAGAIISVMGQLNPHLRDTEDYKHKLWDHLFIISAFELDVDSPYPKPSPDAFESKPELLTYPKNRIKFGYYGASVEAFIAKALAMEPGEDRDEFVVHIANLMKKSFLIWNRNSVEDEVIIEHVKLLSKGKLELKDPSRLESTDSILRLGSNNNNNHSHKKKRHNNNNNNNNNNRKHNKRRN